MVCCDVLLSSHIQDFQDLIFVFPNKKKRFGLFVFSLTKINDFNLVFPDKTEFDFSQDGRIGEQWNPYFALPA